jgi:hypothetical protein
MSEELSPSALWYAAYANPPGIKVKVADAPRAKTILYAARAKLKDEDIAHLEIRASPVDPTGTLWIVNPGDPTLSDPSRVVDLGSI